MNSKKLIALAATVAAGMPLAANAGGFYVGAGIGQAKYKAAEFVDCIGCTGGNFDDSDFAYNIYAGWQLTDAAALEIGYQDWGSPQDTLYGISDVKLEPSMITLMAVGNAKIADNWSVFGKVGLADLSIDGSEGGTGASANEDSIDLAVGGGVQWDIGDRFGVRVETLWVNAEDSDEAIMYGISGLFKFGG